MGPPDAVDQHTKTRLDIQLNEIVKGRKLRQVAAAKLLASHNSTGDVEIVIRSSRDDQEGMFPCMLFDNL